MAEQQAFADVADIMTGYFDGLYHADTKRLAKVFHPDARYVNMIEGDYMNKSLKRFAFDVNRGIPRNDDL